MTTIGTIDLIATIDTSQYKRGAKEIEKSNADMVSSGDKSSSNLTSAFASVAKIGLAAVATAVVAVGALIVKNIGNAIDRVDTLNNSSRTFENMGFSAQAVDGAMKALEKSIRGLPTPLDKAVQGVQMIAASTNDVGKSQKIFSALNNAILGFGGKAEDVTNSVLQMSQAFAGGKIDAQTWNSMLNSNLGPALNAIARQMGITTKALKEGLSDGTISVETFQDALITMNEEGGGGMKSFQTIAKDSTKGISTSWGNMQTAITRGVSEIIKVIGSSTITNAISDFGKTAESSLKGAAGAISDLVDSAKTDGSTLNSALDVTKNSLFGINVQLESLNGTLQENEGNTSALSSAFKAISGVIGFALLGAVVVLGYAVQGVIAIGNSLLESFNNIVNGLSDIIAFFIVKIDEIRNHAGGFFGWVLDQANRLWDRIKNIFVGIATTIGNAVGNAFKSSINGILGFLEGRVNSIIDIVNSAIEAIDKITPGSLPRLGRVSIPKLAQGGIVSSPTLSLIGEGNEPEAVIPLSKLDQMLKNDRGTSNNSRVIINLDGIMARSTADLRDIAKQLVNLIDEERAAKQQPLIMGAK